MFPDDNGGGAFQEFVALVGAGEFGSATAPNPDSGIVRKASDPRFP
jgi:hypothetical protein